ncbi:TetR/AcrR family transcriptional regulator [Nocardioides mangrovi]|uniref:TetR/AcrR family transcriptional regulator n=1 Tax=Nocardioides mangrovi TaxID=2874580 RepID=A0ABS7UBK4_9ACTN|nr:TetR/AcrR family transcriptional regulator [Nocardioides mangrovi]MBZ5738384.1 TetR/AcrR family transcriptional regulator [Nocardioides mangrovi]
MTPPRDVRRAVDLRERDRRILDAAALAFREKGFHGVGMDEIGARAGLSGPSLYRHFSGKDEILATLLHLAMDELYEATAPTGADPADDLDRALRHHVRFALERRDLVVLHQRELGNLAEPWRPAFTARMGHYTRRWEELVARRLPNLDPDEVAAVTQAALGTVFSVSTWPARAHRLATTGGPDVVVELVLELVHGGLDGSLSGT